MESLKESWGPKLWGELRSLDPEEVCERCMVDYNPAGYYSLRTLKTTVNVYPEGERFESDDKTLAESTDFHLLAISYLLYARDTMTTGRWISEKDLQGGSTFFRGPHALPAPPLERRFGNDSDGFREKSASIGGTQMEFGDVSMAFQILPRMSIVVVLWVADDEFPARVTFMLDSSIEGQLPLDVIFAMAQTIVQKLTGE